MKQALQAEGEVREDALDPESRIGRTLVRRVALAALLLLVLLPAMTWVLIDQRGKRAIEEVRASLRVKGEAATLRELAPAPIPEEENYCAIPALEGISVVVGGDSGRGEAAAKRARLSALKPGEVEGRDADLTLRGVRALGWRLPLADQAWLHLEDLEKPPGNTRAAGEAWLRWFEANEMPSELLALGLNRPHARFDPTLPNVVKPGENPWETEFPHFSPIQDASWALLIEGLARLHTGDQEAALRCLETVSRLVESCVNDGTTLGLVVALTVQSRMLILLQEGLWSGLWASSAERQRCEKALSRSRLQPGIAPALRSDLAYGLDGYQFYADAPYGERVAFIRDTVGQDPRLIHAAAGLIPPGWILENAAFNVRILDEELIEAVRRNEVLDGLVRAAESQEARTAALSADRPLGLAIAISARTRYTTFLRRFSFGMARHRQALIVLALERYHEKHRDYPKSLDALPSAPDPRERLDPIDGAPMRYRLLENGDFLLYSIGFDGIDDGGRMPFDEDDLWRTRVTDQQSLGDWPWVREPKALPPLEIERGSEEEEKEAGR